MVRKSLLLVLFSAIAPYAMAQQTVEQCVQKHINEMMAQVPNDPEVRALIEQSIRESIAPIREECERTVREAQRRARPAPPVVRTPAPVPQAPPPGTTPPQKKDVTGPRFRNADWTNATGTRHLPGPGLSVSGDLFLIRNNELAVSYEFRAGFIDHSSRIPTVEVTVTVINKTPCEVDADGALSRDLNTPQEETYAPFSFSGVKIRGYGTFRKVVKISLPGDKEHSIHGMLMAMPLNKCPSS